MCVKIDRFIANDKFTIGRVSIDGEFFCYSLELPWKDNKQWESCIPIGEYKCEPYSSAKYYNVVQIKDVPHRELILIHVGNYLRDTLGCILLGDLHDDKTGIVWNSKSTLARFFDRVGYNFRIKIEGKNMSLIGALVLKKIGKPIFDKLAGKAKERAVAKFTSILKDKFNIQSEADIEKIDESLSKEVLIEAEKVKLGIEEEYTKQTDIINETMQKELTATNIMQKTWRPFVGYCFGFSAALLITTISIITIWSVIKGGNMISDLALVLSNISGLVTIVFGALGGVCGVVGYGRTQEKIKGVKND